MKVTLRPDVFRALGRFSERLEQLEIGRRIETNSDNNVIEIGWNTEKSPEGPRRFVVSQIQIKSLSLVLKTPKE